jgi:hypothetical protein
MGIEVFRRVQKCSKKLAATGPCSEPTESNPHLRTLAPSLQDPHPPTYAYVSQVVSSLEIFRSTFSMHFVFPRACYMSHQSNTS